MRPGIQNSGIQTILGKLCLLLFLSFFLTHCGKNTQQTSTATQNAEGGFALTLPSALKKHQSGANITAQLVIDGGSPITMTVDLNNDQVTASTGPLSPGTHSFVIQYFLDGALITTTTSQAEIIAGQNINIVFTPDLNVNVAPTVLATQPTASATDIATNSAVSATFSQPMDTTSLISLNFTLSNLAGSLAGSVTYAEAPPSFEGRFTPTQTLALAANYTATLSTGITGILGETLAAPQSWTFTTVDGSWGSVQGVDDNSTSDPLNDAATPQIALDANGNAIAVWSQENLGTSGPDDVWANRYVKGSGWGTPQRIETNNAGHARFPQIGVDANGNAIAVWQQSDGTQNDIWANRFNATTGFWGTATRIETDNTGFADSPQISIDANGNAIAIWRQSDGSSDNIMSNRFDAGLGTWGTTPVAIETDPNTARRPQIALDANGNAIAVWEQFDGTRFSIFANRFDIGSTAWGVAETLESDNAGDASLPQIAITATGTALAIWLQNDGSAINVVSNRFVPGIGWPASGTTIDAETTTAFTPEIAIDSQGNAFALWRQANGSGLHIYSSRYESSTGLWGTPGPLETEIVSNVGFPQIAFDANGNAIAVWQQLTSGDSFDNVWGKRYTKNTGWQIAEKIETEDLNNAGFPQLAFNASGNAIAVWIQNDGITTNVQSKFFE